MNQYITWHKGDITMEATFQTEPTLDELATALTGMMLAHGYAPDDIANTIIQYLKDGQYLQDLPMVPAIGDYGLHGSVPG